MTKLLHDFDHAELSKYLSDHVLDFTGLDTVTRFSGGQSNPTYKITSGASSYVMRAKPMGKLLPSAHQVAREFKVMQALAKTDVPAPKMYHLSDDNSPLGTQFFVMEMLDGNIHWDPALPLLDSDIRTTMYIAMAETLAKLHTVDPTDIGLADYGPTGNYFDRQVGRWTKQYRAAETDKITDIDWVIDWLKDNIPSSDGKTRIVHGDFRMDNMMFAPDNSRVIGLLDWELSTLGNPMADIAYQCMCLRLPQLGLIKGLAGVDRTALGIPSEQDYVATYCTKRGVDAPDAWGFYITFAYFRLIAILQGVIKRAMDGNASNPANIDMMRAAIPQLAHAARAATY
ncbi:MAG: aminoglycoside phosphotransferase (APT) family kinase protein [Yoonia sp.]|jgi:aminoglycoside phosphotransferase (APT) family kinase protein